MNKKLELPFPSNMFLKRSRHGDETTKASAVLDHNYLLSQSHQYIIPTTPNCFIREHASISLIHVYTQGYRGLISLCLGDQ